MKNIIAVMAVCAAVCLASCNKMEPLAQKSDYSNIQFNIAVSDPSGDDTKTVKSGWSTGDKLNIWLDYNWQATPDLVMTYDGSKWNAGDLREGATLQSSGYMRALFEEKNDLSKYTATSRDLPWLKYTQFGFEKETDGIGEAYKVPLFVSSCPIPYTFDSGIFTANINSWFHNMDLRVFISGLKCGEWGLESDKSITASAFYVSNSVSQEKPQCIETSNEECYSFNSEAEGGCIFYMKRRSSFTNEDITFTLYDFKNKQTYTYTASGKTLSSYVRGSAPTKINLTAAEFGITPIDDFTPGGEIVISASIKTPSVTKSNYLWDDASKVLKCSWENGDKISLISLKSGVVKTIDTFTTSCADSSSVATFTGTFTGTDYDQLKVVYPALTEKDGDNYIAYQNKKWNMPQIHFTLNNQYSHLNMQYANQTSNGSTDALKFLDLMQGEVTLNGSTATATLHKNAIVFRCEINTDAIADLNPAAKLYRVQLISSPSNRFRDSDWGYSNFNDYWEGGNSYPSVFTLLGEKDSFSSTDGITVPAKGEKLVVYLASYYPTTLKVGEMLDIQISTSVKTFNSATCHLTQDIVLNPGSVYTVKATM